MQDFDIRPVYGWHFLCHDMTSWYEQKPWRPGETRHVTGPIATYRNGYHAGTSIFDALPHAGGPILCRVQLHGEIDRRAELLAARSRTLIECHDITDELVTFADECATRAVQLTSRDIADYAVWLAELTLECGAAGDDDVAGYARATAHEARLAILERHGAEAAEIENDRQRQRLDELILPRFASLAEVTTA